MFVPFRIIERDIPGMLSNVTGRLNEKLHLVKIVGPTHKATVSDNSIGLDYLHRKAGEVAPTLAGGAHLERQLSAGFDLRWHWLVQFPLLVMYPQVTKLSFHHSPCPVCHERLSIVQPCAMMSPFCFFIGARRESCPASRADYPRSPRQPWHRRHGRPHL